MLQVADSCRDPTRGDAIRAAITQVQTQLEAMRTDTPTDAGDPRVDALRKTLFALDQMVQVGITRMFHGTMHEMRALLPGKPDELQRVYIATISQQANITLCHTLPCRGSPPHT